MSRVVSKHLFNFPLNGVLDEDVAAEEKNMDGAVLEMLIKVGGMAMEHELNDTHDPKSNLEYVNLFRKSLEGLTTEQMKHPILVKAKNECIESKIKVPTTHDGEYDVEVYVHTPKKLAESKNNAAFIYAHGGGAIAFSAADHKNTRAHIAVECDVVAFDVEYRLAPETKCPNNVKDFYAVIKYVSENAANLGIDASKIVIAGESGGGYICLGAMVMLAQNDESSLVKLAMPDIPMVGDLVFSDPLAMTKDERDSATMMRKNWRLIASDMDKQKDDPLLFPGKAGDELLAKMPPTIILEVEFDLFITEAGRMANRLRVAGRLLEYVVIPGVKHGSTFNANFKCFTTAIDIRRLALNEYLHN